MFRILRRKMRKINAEKIVRINWKTANFDLIFLTFNALEDHMVLIYRNFNSILRRNHLKNSYERSAYESVDEKSLS